MERRRGKNELALAQRELSHILNSVPGMITRVDRDGRLVFVNRAYVEMMQRPAEALIGRALRELLLPADFARLQPSMDRVLAGQVTAFSRTQHLADGGVMELEGRLVPEFDDHGRVFGWIAIFHDATEAQRARALLAESEARFRQLTMLSSDWYWEQDEQLRFTFMSAGLEKHTGMKAQEHFGQARWDVPALNLSEEDWARHRAQLERHEPFRDFEMQRPDRQGRLHWVSISGDPVFDEEGRFRGYRGVGRDITEVKEAADRNEKINEELEERVEARTADLRAAIKELDAFTYSVSHDLRAPVGAIAGFTHLLRSSADEQLSADGRRLLGFVEQNATRMVGLIEGLLRFARLGREDLRRTWLSMNELAGEALLDFAEAAAGAEIRVGELPECHGDRALIGQVWANLVGNALKYARGAAAGPRGNRLGRTQAGLFRQGQRRRLRHGLRRQAVRRLRAPAPRIRIRGQRHRPGHRRAYREASRRRDLGRGAGRRRRHVLVYGAGHAARRPGAATVAGALADR